MGVYPGGERPRSLLSEKQQKYNGFRKSTDYGSKQMPCAKVNKEEFSKSHNHMLDVKTA